MKTKQILGIAAGVLALLLLITGFWAFGLKGDRDRLTTEKENLNKELTQIQELKNQLEVEVDSLESAYNVLAEENQTLQTSMEEAEQKIQSREASIRALRRELATTNKNAAATGDDLRSQITTLINAKTALENTIRDLKSENDSLRMRAGVLEQNLNQAREENAALANLNRTMDEELKRLTLANFKASAFRVEVQQKRGEKITAKSRRARKLAVSFDLTEVPQKYQGVRPVYLVITDEKAVPIKVANPTPATVVVNNQSMELLAAESKEVNIENNQRLSFTHELDNRLAPGYYRVVVYTDIGLLGATSFRLR